MTIFEKNSKMTDPKPSDTAEWKHPHEVMQLHRLKMRKRALQARMNRTSVGSPKPSLDITITGPLSELASSASQKRKNPFLKSDQRKRSRDDLEPDLEASTDSVLFELMKGKASTSQNDENIEPKKSESPSLSFSSALSKLQSLDNYVAESESPKGVSYVPIDWSLNTKVRFMSSKPFPWNGKLKTSEQASGTTGFVRCLDIGEQETTLDTSPNARFHRCCLVWQHPSLPWLELFPRAAGRVSASLASNSAIANNQFVKDALFSEWSESFRSLFHLLRARQCPFFYVCANNFTALFRAAGICGVSEVHVLLTPTTRGFRQALKQEDIEYTMPLRSGGKRRSDTTDSGCDTLDSTSNTIVSPDPLNDDYYLNDDDDGEDDLLESLGIEDSEIKKINNVQKRITFEKEAEVDALKQSLVFVKGVEAQALFNFLINCKSAVAVTGALAGVPPTLLAPIAFHGATLKPLKVRESIVRVDKDKFHSLEIKGPLLPHILPSLCHLMKSSHLEQFSVSFAQLSSTNAFSTAKHGLESPSEDENGEIKPQSVFGQENLSDCGFNSELLSHFCNPDTTHIQVIETLKFSNDVYTWS
ncbi:protein downstream neighbor of son homolog [Diachasma alloeum]|uniref:protein downstream neighbor of son homolog n=1 Tax=Diachasma alloeum TaxID=454923 RepID=UPI000738405F|nr:protein downstream neighbor of son homolog [Diachasma alloeum]